MSGQEWLATFDINPLIFTGGRFVAVDALCLVTPASSTGVRA
jgi:hypothetical protein